MNTCRDIYWLTKLEQSGRGRSTHKGIAESSAQSGVDEDLCDGVVAPSAYFDGDDAIPMDVFSWYVLPLSTASKGHFTLRVMYSVRSVTKLGLSLFLVILVGFPTRDHPLKQKRR